MTSATRTAWGPDRKSAAVSITFDNLGEAADIALNRWPKDAPIGQHYTATDVLPRLIDLVAGIPATYFIEGINAERYPEAIQAWLESGHEVGLHGYVHESWEGLSFERKRSDLVKSLAAMEHIGVRPVGFRPPGGVFTKSSAELLSENGFEYCSPVGNEWGDFEADGLQMLPFHWRQVDAYLLDADLGEFRAKNGDPSMAATTAQWRTSLHTQWLAALEAKSHLTVIFHPYLFGANAGQWQVLEEFIQLVRSHDDVWLASTGTVADWLASNTR